MNILKTFFFLLVVSSLTLSCDTSSNDKTETIADSTHQQTTEDNVDILQNKSLTIRKLFKTSKGIFRGIDFNSSIANTVKAEDSIEVIEKTNTYIKYNLTFNVLESADITYSYNKDSVISIIEVDLYPKNAESQSTFFNEISAYLNEKYGQATESSDKKMVWNVQDSKITVILQKEGNKKVHDLELNFIPSSANPL